MKTVLVEPIRLDDLTAIHVGDVIYYTGHIVTCRDVGHRRLIEEGMPLPVDLTNSAILHAGPIVRKREDGTYEMVSIGPTTSMRMEKFEEAFIEKTGVRLIVGKGGMGSGTEAGCRKGHAIHCVFPAGCAVLAASCVEEIERVEWTDGIGAPG
ncbi:MAG: L(+)-tartrate dehydratase subunit beta, partial [Clostridia bacterium]|nr:L(+)-tartrate dehydratase subunit beta [Clostridia bacterium]